MIPADHITFDGDMAWWVLDEDYEFDSVHARSLDRPCEWCQRHLSSGAWPNCPDCNGTGRHTFQIEVECDVCADRAEWCGFDGIGNPLCSNGTVALRVSIVPGMVLPIVSAEQYRNDMSLRGPFVIAYSDGTTSVYHNTSDIRVTPLPPAAKPGDWAVQLNVQPKEQA